MTAKWCMGLIGVFLVCSCSSNQPVRSPAAASDATVAIAGIASGSAATASLDLEALGLDLAALVAARGDIGVMSQQSVRQIIGAAPHEEILGSIARYAHLAPYQTQRLMAANLRASHALFARIDADIVEYLPVITQDFVDKSGTKVAGRVRQIYVTRRSTQLSATLLDMKDGQVVWTRQYRVTPETSSTVTKSVGQNLGASMAAAVANSVMQSNVQGQYPEPASLQDSVLALLQEVAYRAPMY